MKNKKNEFNLSNYVVNFFKSKGFNLKKRKPIAHSITCGAYSNNDIKYIGHPDQKSF